MDLVNSVAFLIAEAGVIMICLLGRDKLSLTELTCWALAASFSSATIFIIHNPDRVEISQETLTYFLFPLINAVPSIGLLIGKIRNIM